MREKTKPSPQILPQEEAISNLKSTENLPKKENNLILKLDNYTELPFEDLLRYVSYIVDYYYRNKLELTIKHRDSTFYLNQSQSSFQQILKYLANVKN